MLVDGSYNRAQSELDNRESDNSRITYLDVTDPVDIRRPIERFCGNQKMYYGMLKRLE